MKLSVITESNIGFTVITCPELLDWAVKYGAIIAFNAPRPESDNLLPKLISCELRVKDVKKILESIV